MTTVHGEAPTWTPDHRRGGGQEAVTGSIDRAADDQGSRWRSSRLVVPVTDGEGARGGCDRAVGGKWTWRVAMGRRAMSGCRRDRVHLLFMSVSFRRRR
jgi:hypothetical protein